MVFDGFVWNTRPGACELEPPGANSGPWSTTVTWVQPRSVSSSASALPTTPAPMTTTRGDSVMSCTLRCALRLAQHPGTVALGTTPPNTTPPQHHARYAPRLAKMAHPVA